MSGLERQSRALDTIASELRHEVEQAELNWQSAVGHAIRAGELLTEAKAQVKHGEWLLWLEANFLGSERTARNYMRLAANSATVADLPTIREAVAVLAEPKPDEPKITKGQAHAFTEAAAGWLGDGVEWLRSGAYRDEPLPPPPLPPEDTDDHLAMARYWIEVAERARIAVRRTGKRALVMAAQSEGSTAAAYARAGAAALALAEAEPFGEEYEELHDEWSTALHGLEPLPEAEDEVVAFVLGELARLSSVEEAA